MKAKLTMLFVLLMLAFNGQGQTNADTFNTLLSNLIRFNKDHPQEKVHLHFDKPYYALGDTIWFEGYVVNALNNVPSYQSPILNVELIDAKGAICKSVQLPVNVGFAAGDLELADSLRAGNYRIRAYTAWMKNFSSDYFFDKRITVANPFPASVSATAGAATTTAATPLAAHTTDVQFFPEGGQLVNGIRSAIGFKVTSYSGLGAELSGKLVDEQNKEVLTFKTTHAGMGSFMLTPQPGKIYRAVVKVQGEAERSIPLPQALTSGYVLTAANSNADSLTITMLCSPDLVNKGEMVLMPLSNGNPLFFFRTRFPDKRVNVTAPRSKLPGGILQFTLFNANNEPVAERLVFNNYNKRLNINVPDLRQTYRKRDKSVLTLQTADVNGNPLLGSFSMSVTNADNVEPNENGETTIFSNLLLTSDLKGYIENPNYYFTDASAEKNVELDNLMLTQGWRRFVWKDMEAGTFGALQYPITDFASISGTVVRDKKLMGGTQVSLLPAKLGTGIIRDTVTDANGHFAFPIPAEQLYNRFIVQAKQKHEYEGLVVKLDNIKPPVFSAGVLPSADSVDSTITTYAKASAKRLLASGHTASMFGKSTRLKEVVIKDYNPKKKLINSHSRNLNGVGNADYVITGKEVENWPDLRLMQGMIAGLKISGDARGMATNAYVLVDGNPVQDLSLVSPRDVESIEYLRSAGLTAVYGLRAGASPVLIITTKQGPDAADTSRSKSMLTVGLPIHLTKEFYSPKYDNPEVLSKVQDLRTTVFWKPDVVTNTEGKATVQFYNNDVAGNYRIVIEGVSTQGHLCRQVYSYKVE